MFFSNFQWNISKDIETKDLTNLALQTEKPKYSYSIGSLEYDTLYNITVFAITTYGQKGNIAQAFIQTVQVEKEVEDEPYLYFGRGSVLYKKKIDIQMPFDLDIQVYDFKAKIVSMDVHSAQNTLYISDETGRLYKFDLDKNIIEKEVKSPLRNILTISVDWLYNFVYIASDTHVHKCTLDLECTYFVGQDGSMSNFKVDPYHGFYFWIEDTDKLVQAELCNHGKMERKIILEKSTLSDFVLQFDQSKLQIADLPSGSLYEIDVQSQRSKSNRVAAK